MENENDCETPSTSEKTAEYEKRLSIEEKRLHADLMKSSSHVIEDEPNELTDQILGSFRRYASTPSDDDDEKQKLLKSIMLSTLNNPDPLLGKSLRCRIVAKEPEGYAVKLTENELDGFVPTNAKLQPGDELAATYVTIRNNRILLSYCQPRE